jgi:hypothetical protein
MASKPLSDEQRAVVDLILNKGMSHSEIASILEIPEEHVRALAAEAGQRLQELMAEGAGEAEGGDNGGEPRGEDSGQAGMLIAFFGYLVAIVAGLSYMIVIGLEHH